MYFYEIGVDHSLLGSEKIVMGSDDRFNNHQLNIIVQEAFDECIEKYCNKPVLGKGEEACRMEVGTIFEKHLPLQLKNHGFKSIKINATCFIHSGTLFTDDTTTNRILKNRYKDKILPPCRKCIRKGGDGCIVPNIVKYPYRCYIKPFSVPFDENEEEHNTDDDFNISVLKQYFTNSNRSVEDSEIAAAALENILDNNNFEYFYTEHRAKADSIHERDMFCWFDLDTDKERFKKLLENYGFTFTFDDDEDGFWITGVKK